MKQLNIIEAMKMPIGTKFTVVHDAKGTNASNIILCSYSDNKFFEWEGGDRMLMISDNIFATFIPIQQPVSFMEVVNSDKPCKVEHELIRNEYYLNNYFGFSKLMNTYSTCFSSKELRKIIKKGKWYLEE